MKNKVLFLVVISFLFSVPIKAQDDVQIIGSYSYWINSMCSQGCEGYNLAYYSLPEKLTCINDQYGSNQVVFSQGSLTQEEVYYTVAGPRADQSKMGETYSATMFNAASCEEITNFGVSNSKEVDGGYEITFSLDNPTKEDLQLVILFDSSENEYITLPAEGNYVCVVFLEEPDYYVNYLIVNSSVTTMRGISMQDIDESLMNDLVSEYTKVYVKGEISL